MYLVALVVQTKVPSPGIGDYLGLLCILWHQAATNSDHGAFERLPQVRLSNVPTLPGLSSAFMRTLATPKGRQASGTKVSQSELNDRRTSIW